MGDVDLSIFDDAEEEKGGEGPEDPVEKILATAQELRHQGAVLKVAMDIPSPRELPQQRLLPTIIGVLDHYNVAVPAEVKDKLSAGAGGEIVFLVSEDDSSLRPRKVVINLHPEVRTLFIRGEAPLNGLDSFVELFIDYQVRAGKVREDGTIDFREINRFPQAREGELLVRLYEPTPGVPGIDVYGKPVPPQPGRALEIKAGEGVELRAGFDEEKSRKTEEFVAERSGVVICEFQGEERVPEKLKGLSVKNQIEVTNVDFTTGNLGSEVEEIRCIADVVVKGDIKGLFSVIIDGNLEVHGSVEGRLIDVSETFSALFVKSRVKAGKEITVGSCLNAELEAGGAVVVERECTQSRVSGIKVFFKPKGVPHVLCGGGIVEADQVTLDRVSIRNRLMLEVAPRLLAKEAKLEKLIQQAQKSLEQDAGKVKDGVNALVAKMQALEKGCSHGPILESMKRVRQLVAGMLKGEVTTSKVEELARSLLTAHGGALRSIARGLEGVAAIQERINVVRRELDEYQTQLQEVEEELLSVAVVVKGVMEGNGSLLVRFGNQELSWDVGADGRPTPIAIELKYVPKEGLILVGN